MVGSGGHQPLLGRLQTGPCHHPLGPSLTGRRRRTRWLETNLLMCLGCCTILTLGGLCWASNVCSLDEAAAAAGQDQVEGPEGTGEASVPPSSVPETDQFGDQQGDRRDEAAVEASRLEAPKQEERGDTIMKVAASSMTGRALPFLYGTAWKKERTTDLVLQAVLAGFRGIDTACQPKHYREDLVGAALKRLAEEHGVRRDSLWLQTKYTPVSGQDPADIPYDPSLPPPQQALQSVQKSLQNLGTEWIDSLLLHSPLSTGEETLEVWRALETAVDNGTVGQLGISNLYDFEHFKWLHSSARHKPAVLQNRFYRESGYDKELREFCLREGVTYQTFWTLTANPHVLNSSPVQSIMARLSEVSPGEVTPAQVFFKFLIQSGHQPLTGTKSPVHMEQDLAAPHLPDLTDSEMQAIEALLE